MKTVSYIICLLITTISVDLAFAQELSNSSSSMGSQAEQGFQKSNKLISGAAIEAKRRAESDAAMKALVEKSGQPYEPPQEGIPGYVEEYFSMPQNELLMNCGYTIGYSFPDICTDGRGNIIFDSSKDNQAVLNKIIKKQGKQGKYNKMPNGGPVKYNGVD